MVEKALKVLAWFGAVSCALTALAFLIDGQVLPALLASVAALVFAPPSARRILRAPSLMRWRGMAGLAIYLAACAASSSPPHASSPAPSPSPVADSKPVEKPKTPQEIAAEKKALEIEEKARAAAALAARQNDRPLDFVSLKTLKWVKGGYSNVMIADFRISSALPFAVRDPDIYCELFAPSGTGLGSVEKKVYETLAPGKSLTVRGLNMGLIDSQARRANCDVVWVRH